MVKHDMKLPVLDSKRFFSWMEFFAQNTYCRFKENRSVLDPTSNSMEHSIENCMQSSAEFSRRKSISNSNPSAVFRSDSNSAPKPSSKPNSNPVLGGFEHEPSNAYLVISGLFDVLGDNLSLINDEILGLPSGRTSKISLRRSRVSTNRVSRSARKRTLTSGNSEKLLRLYVIKRIGDDPEIVAELISSCIHSSVNVQQDRIIAELRSNTRCLIFEADEDHVHKTAHELAMLALIVRIEDASSSKKSVSLSNSNMAIVKNSSSNSKTRIGKVAKRLNLKIERSDSASTPFISSRSHDQFSRLQDGFT